MCYVSIVKEEFEAHLFPYSYSLVAASFVKKSLLSSLNFFGALNKRWPDPCASISELSSLFC